MKRAAEDLECLGIYLPRDYLFSLGTPRKEFGLRIDFLNGRIGDNLRQLAKFIHGMHALNLVLYVRSKFSKHRSVMLFSTETFDE